jgi:glucose uptake protein GlcU
MAVAGLIAVVAVAAGVLMLTDHKSGRGVIFIVAGVVAAPPRMRWYSSPPRRR